MADTSHPNHRFDRWSLRYKGFELAQIECLAHFKLTNNREKVDIELWPLNDHARKMVDELKAANREIDDALGAALRRKSS